MASFPCFLVLAFQMHILYSHVFCTNLVLGVFLIYLKAYSFLCKCINAKRKQEHHVKASALGKKWIFNKAISNLSSYYPNPNPKKKLQYNQRHTLLAYNPQGSRLPCRTQFGACNLKQTQICVRVTVNLRARKKNIPVNIRSCNCNP
jgi:hypothetical protein